jgi:hypothetical protein
VNATRWHPDHLAHRAVTGETRFLHAQDRFFQMDLVDAGPLASWRPDRPRRSS